MRRIEGNHRRFKPGSTPWKPVEAGREPLASLRMAEEFARVGDVDICFETFGSRDDPAMLLVMGLGTQMVAWPELFCRQLAERGFFVIRYDNRDVGRSTHLRWRRSPTIRQLLLRDKSAASYSLADMAHDGIGLLDQLGIERAHVVGVSMGGMIAQTMAARHPDRVLSLASIMSNTGHLWRGTPGLRIYPIFVRRPKASREGAVESFVSVFKLIGSPGFPFDEAETRKAAELSYDRGYNPAGTGRQLAAILAAGDRTSGLRRITAPTVVIHGTKDRMVRPSGGRATAAAIPGARLVMIDGMGHDLPRGAWDRMIEAIVGNAQRADASDMSTAAA
jgi:pimeloyl-ACP methyl ester carboxylesterase